METLQKISRDVLTYINNRRPKITIIDFEEVIKHVYFDSFFEIIYPDHPSKICFSLVNKTTGAKFNFCTHKKSRDKIKPILNIYWDTWIRPNDKTKEVGHFEWIESEKHDQIIFYPSVQRCLADQSMHYDVVDFLIKNNFIEKEKHAKIQIGQKHDYVIGYDKIRKEWVFEIVISEHVAKSMREMTGDIDRPWLDQD